MPAIVGGFLLNLPVIEECYAAGMDKTKILMTAKTEFLRHHWGTFVDESPSLARGSRGTATMGCPRCRKRLNTIDEYMRHLADDVLPPIVDLVLTLAKAD